MTSTRSERSTAARETLLFITFVMRLGLFALPSMIRCYSWEASSNEKITVAAEVL